MELDLSKTNHWLDKLQLDHIAYQEMELHVFKIMALNVILKLDINVQQSIDWIQKMLHIVFQETTELVIRM